MKKIMAVVLIAALVLSMNGCVSIYTLMKSSGSGNDSATEVLAAKETLIPSLKPSATPTLAPTLAPTPPPTPDAESPYESPLGDTDGQKADQQKENEQKVDEQNADTTGGLHINQILLDCLSWHLSDLEAYCGGSLPPISFEDDVVFYYALPGYWDTYLAFTYANEAENQTDDAKLVRIETCTISAFTRESVSASELKDVTCNTFSVEENGTEYFLRTEIDGALCRFVAQSKDDPAMTNLILYEKHE